MHEWNGTDRKSGYVIVCDCFEIWYTMSLSTLSTNGNN